LPYRPQQLNLIDLKEIIEQAEIAKKSKSEAHMMGQGIDDIPPCDAPYLCLIEMLTSVKNKLEPAVQRAVSVADDIDDCFYNGANI
jgi:biotin synthase-like enzyme